MARGKAKTKSMAEVMKEAADVPPAPPAAREPSMVEVLSRIAFALEQIERKLEAPRVEGGHSPAGYGTGVATKPAAEVVKEKEPVAPDVATRTLQAAASVGAAKVKALLHRFNVQKAGELSDEDKPRYLKALEALK